MKVLENIAYYAQTHPKRSALQFDDFKCNYKQLKERIELAMEDTINIPSHHFVGLVMKNPMETIIYYFALLKRGCIPCVLDFRWSQAQIDSLLEHYGISYIIRDFREVIYTAHYSNKMKWCEEDILHIGFTSGTTGLPKAYYRNERSWLCSYEENEKLMSEVIDIIVALGPLSHSLSLYACIYALYSGRTFIGQQQFNASLLLKKIEMNSQTVAMFTVPTMLLSCVAENIEISGLRYIFTTGDKLHSKLRLKVKRNLPQVILIEFFGTSEASFISYNYNNKAPYNSVGLPFPNVKIYLAHQDEQNVGILNIKSNMTFSGYVDTEVGNSEWIEIGDFASIDCDGYLYLHGRQCDRLIIGGRNVYPSEIETVIQQCDAFDEVCVVSEPHSKFGQIAVLLYTGEQEVSYQTLRTSLAPYLARYQIPSKLLRIDKMHYTESGKIARKQMQETNLEGGFSI